MNLKFTGAVLAVAVMASLALVPFDASGESPDIREAELYAGFPFVYSPSGGWADAKASGTALDAGIAWADGTLSGTIDAPGTYLATIESAGKAMEIALTVVQAPNGGAMAGDASDGSAEGITAPTVSALKVSGDGRSVIVSAEVADAEKLTYNWGDGTRSVVTVESVLQGAQHTYREAGAYSVVITAEGPYAAGYAVAMYDAPADALSSTEGHQLLIGVVLLILTASVFAAFIITWDYRLLYVIVALAVINVIALLWFGGFLP